MAKVESVSSSSSFYANKSPFPELKFGLGIDKDCSPKCEFDISSLLDDNETCLEKQYIDDDNWSLRKRDNKKGKHSSITTESPKFASLGALAENHLKKNKMFPELNFDGDFNLSDLLSNDDCSDVKESKNAVLCENDSLFDLCLLTEDDNNLGVERSSSAKNDISVDDLTKWMTSSVTLTSDSLKFLHNPQFSCGDKLDNVSPASLNKKTQNINTLVSNQEESESKNKIPNVNWLNILGDISIDNFNTTDSCEKQEPVNEISDDDLLPDIDLTFCIKKNSKNDFSLYGNSPETIDSGFDESDFVPDKLIPPHGQLFYKNNFLFQNSTCNKSAKIKQSLFSRAISAKPKIDDLRKSKLKVVMNELLKGSVPLLHCRIQQKNALENQKVIDHSNEHVITSTYLNVGDEKY